MIKGLPARDRADTQRLAGAINTLSHAPRALITGASAGIGAEFARQLAAGGFDLVLVARDEARLQERASELRAAYGVKVEVLAASGTDRVTMLVNNAGFGLVKPFDENGIEDEQHLPDLIVTAPMRLAHAALGQMLGAASGTIVNIASVAGYAPRGTYGVSKAWVLSFSRWANLAYRARGVAVTAVSPGFVHTEFHDRMDVSKDGVPAFLWLDAATLVRLALRDVRKGRAVSIPTLRYKIVVTLSGLLPKRIVAVGALRGR